MRRLSLSVLLLVLVCIGWAPSAAAQPASAPLLRAHAHNDYEHPRPLLDALDHGFNAVEADIHLVDGELLVAHDREKVVPGRTLESLYLAPLRQRMAHNGGSVYPGGGPPLLLLVDIKGDAEATYVALRRLLRRYATILTLVSGQRVMPGAVTVVLSGNRPLAAMQAEPLRFASFDGRLDDLRAGGLPASFMPLVSSPWTNVTLWQGQGGVPVAARRKLVELVQLAQSRGYQLRFWGSPDVPAVWQLLYDTGVDLINTDDLPGLRAFLLAQGAP